MPSPSPVNVSDAVEGLFKELTDSLCRLQKQYAYEKGDSVGTNFDALRVYMIGAAVYLAGHSAKTSDSEFRDILHKILDMGISDCQFNERLHAGSKEGS